MKNKAILGILISFLCSIILTGCGGEKGVPNDLKFTSEKILIAKKIKSLDTLINNSTSINTSRFGIGYSVKTDGEAIYYIYTEEPSTNGYTLEDIPAKDTIIKEVDSNFRAESEYTYILTDKVEVLDDKTSQSLLDIFEGRDTNNALIDNKPYNYHHIILSNSPINSMFEIESPRDKTIFYLCPDNELDLLTKVGKLDIPKDKDIYISKSKTILYVPKGFLHEEFNALKTR